MKKILLAFLISLIFFFFKTPSIHASSVWSCTTAIDCPSSSVPTQESFSMTQGQSYTFRIISFASGSQNNSLCSTQNISITVSDDLNSQPPHNEVAGSVSGCNLIGPTQPNEIDLNFTAQSTQSSYYLTYQNTGVSFPLNFEIDTANATLLPTQTDTPTPTATPLYTDTPTPTSTPTYTPVPTPTYTPVPTALGYTPTPAPTYYANLNPSNPTPTPTEEGSVLGASTSASIESSTTPSTTTESAPNSSCSNFFTCLVNNKAAVWGIIITVLGASEYLIFKHLWKRSKSKQ